MEIIRLTDANIEMAAKKAAAILKKGGIIAYPTDTIYGLGVHAHHKGAIEKLRLLKGREKRKPFSVIVPDIDSIGSCATITDAAYEIAKRHLPGPLTIVLPAHESLPEEITLNGAIGVRIPNDAFCQALAKELGAPFTTTSANKSGQGTPRDADGIIYHFGPAIEHVDLIVDGGLRASGNPSTVISCTGDTPRILREGAIPRETLGL